MVLLLTVSLVILYANSLFYINDFISFPQHGHFDHFDDVSKVIKAEKNGLYKTFFFLDFIWAPLLLLWVGWAIYGADKKLSLSIINKNKTLKWYFFFAVIAYGLDVWEGILYLTYNNTILEKVTTAKILAYLVCFGFVIYAFIKRHVIPNKRSFTRFLWTSCLSLFFIAAIYLLVTVMEQGGTLVVHLFYSPVNIILFFFVLNFLAILISHYPVYMDIWTYDETGSIKLHMSNAFRFLGFGIIFYDTSKADPKYWDQIAQPLRRSLGILLYAAVFRIMLGVIAKFYEASFNILYLTLGILSLSLFIYYLEGKKYNHWMEVLYGKKKKAGLKGKVMGQIHFYVKYFPWYFLLCIVAVLLTAWYVGVHGWSKGSVLFFMVTLGLQLFLYVMFKISRSMLKYVYEGPHLFSENPKMFHPKVRDSFHLFYDLSGVKRFKFFSFFGLLSNNVTYLKLMRFSGVFSLIAIILANSSVPIATFLNPINIILLYIILVYSIIAILLKHLMFYHRNGVTKYTAFFKYGIPFLITVLVLAGNYLAKQENDLHQLDVVKRENKLADTTYVNTLLKRTESTSGNYFVVGSYGGGLKANLWNLLLLNELDNSYGDHFFGRTLAMSGVSGGALGIGNFTALHAQNGPITKERLNQQIRTIGESNVLSNELTYLLGWDWIREFVPLQLYKKGHGGRDRSYKSMATHAKNTGMEVFNTYSFEDYWSKAYENRKKRFPALLMNSTGVGGQQGIATSIGFPAKTFPAAKLTNAFDGLQQHSSLTFYGAVSTTNRFPFFSPTAKIKEKGAFLDGGYFENSGMLSAYEAFYALAGNPTKPYYNKINPVFISIVNSKEFYTTEVLKSWGLTPNYKQDKGEIQSILETLASIEKMPRYAFDRIRGRGFVVEQLMMPHKLKYEQLEKYLGEIENPLALIDSIQVHNAKIDDALKEYEDYCIEDWGVVEPPLARLLSKPAVRYQEAMVKKHPDLRNKIDTLLDKFINLTEKLDTETRAIMEK